MNLSKPIKLPENINEARKLITYGTSQMYQGDFLRAISTFNKALELHPDSLFAFQYRAICRHHLLMNTNNISDKAQAKAMRDIISDLEKALNTAENLHKFLASNS